MMREIRVVAESWYYHCIEGGWSYLCPAESHPQIGYDDDDVIAAQRLAAKKYQVGGVRVDPGTVAVKY